MVGNQARVVSVSTAGMVVVVVDDGAEVFSVDTDSEDCIVAVVD